ncbi:hypothetical protein HPB51_010877 [Rhipicephalus microplus]|uniref:Tick transposon n=1 Tax=Rhipicephalus microplus TaxID=6941 RepID=A0A9J6DLM1_RHIMP|nr:hypothetical protein HPB51_010877 [Rhipicephalus microplus]
MSLSSLRESDSMIELRGRFEDSNGESIARTTNLIEPDSIRMIDVTCRDIEKENHSVALARVINLIFQKVAGSFTRQQLESSGREFMDDVLNRYLAFMRDVANAAQYCQKRHKQEEEQEEDGRKDCGISAQGTGFYVSPVKEDTEWKWAKAVKTQVQLSETDTRRRNMEQKAIRYGEHKQDICVETLFDNSVASSLLFGARAGTLQTLAYRQRFDDSVNSAMCRVCGAVEDTIEHLVGNCEDLTTVPTDGTTLQQALGFSQSDVPKGDGVVSAKRRLND